MNGVVKHGCVYEHRHKKQHKLDTKADDVRKHNGYWKYESGEIHFAKNSGIGNKGGRGGCEASRKVIPNCDTCHVKKNWLDAIGGDFSHFAKEEQKHGGGE
jgi:hypothetical protein